MPTYNAADLNSKPVVAAQACGVIYDGKVVPGAATQTGDKLNVCRIPAGTRLCEVSVRVKTAFGTAAPTQWVLQPVDGSTATEIVAAGDTVLNTVNKKDLAFEPVTIEKDSFLQAVVGTVNTGAAGEATVTASGMALGAK